MLDIVPAEVQALYKKDGINKNLRIHFPNGEMEDLTNKNVVYETMDFKESVCSSDAFKFGLCEAGELKFETVDVDNMIDMVIEASLEIDVSSLNTYNKISKCWENSFTGKVVRDKTTEEWIIDNTGSESDIEKPVFSIPIGTFKVDSCPRSHSNMRHREVTAYTKSFKDNEDLTPFETWRLGRLHKKVGNLDNGSLFKMYLPQYMDTQIDRVNMSEYYDTLIMTPSSGSVITPKNNGYEATNTTGFKLADGVYVYLKGLRKIVAGLDANSRPHIYRSVRNDVFYTYESFKETVLSNLDSSIKIKESVLKDFYNNHLFSYCVTYATNVFFDIKGIDNYPVYPYDQGMNTTGQLTFANSVILSVNGTEITLSDNMEWFTVTRYSFKNGTDLKCLTINITSNLDTQEGTYRYSFYNSFTMLDLMSGYLELHALFGNQERDGKYAFFRLTRENPIKFDASLYKDFWWDEYDVDPIGYVLYTFKDEEGKSQETVTYKISEDATSLYDMTSNGVIEKIEGATKRKIQNLIDSCFKDHLDAIHFVPVDFSAKGLPYIEDGDYIEVDTPDGSTIDTFILTRSLSGIQSLTDSITSTSGDIIAGEELEEAEEPEE